MDFDPSTASLVEEEAFDPSTATPIDDKPDVGDVTRRATEALELYRQDPDKYPKTPQELHDLNLIAQGGKGFYERFKDKALGAVQGVPQAWEGLKKAGSEMIQHQKEIRDQALNEIASGDPMRAAKAVGGAYLDTTKNLGAGAVAGVDELAPLAVDLVNAGLQASPVNYALEKAFPQDSQSTEAWMNTAADIAHARITDAGHKIAQAVGADERSIPYEAGKQVAQLGVGGPEALSIASKAPAIAGKIVDKGAQVANAAAGKIASVAADVAPAAITAGAVGLMPHGSPAQVMYELGGALLAGRVKGVRQAISGYVQKPLRDFAEEARQVARGPEGLSRVEAIQHALGQESDTINSEISALRKGIGDKEAQLLDEKSADGAPLFSSTSDALGPTAKKIRAREEAVQSIQDKIDSLDAHKDFSKLTQDAAKLGVSIGITGTEGAAIGAGIGGAASPVGDNQSASAGAILGAGIGAAGGAASFKGGYFKARSDEMVKAGKDFIDPNDPDYKIHQESIEALGPQADTVHKIQALAKPFGTKVVALSPEEALARSTSGNMPPTEGRVAPNGWFDRDSNTIYLNRDAIASGVAEHELIHPLQEALGFNVINGEGSTPEMEALRQQFNDLYTQALNRTKKAGTMNEDKINTELEAELGRDILQSNGPEAFYGGKSGGTIISEALKRGLDRVLKRNVEEIGQKITTQGPFQAPATGKQRSEMTDILYQIGEKAKQGRQEPKIRPPQTPQEPVGASEGLASVNVAEKAPERATGLQIDPIYKDAVAALNKLGVTDPEAKVQSAYNDLIQENGDTVPSLEELVKRSTQKTVPQSMMPNDLDLGAINDQDIPHEQDNQRIPRDEAPDIGRLGESRIHSDRTVEERTAGGGTRQGRNDALSGIKISIDRGGIRGSGKDAGRIDQSSGLDSRQLMPNSHPDAIKRAAVKLDDGSVWEGITHSHAISDAVAHYGKLGQRPPNMAADRGFVTNSGEYLDRRAAEKRALKFRQIPNRSKYGTGLEAITFDRGNRQKFMPSSSNDTLQGPAIQTEDGITIRGATHDMAVKEADRLGLDVKGAKTGFITKKGSFLEQGTNGKDDALKWGQEIGQLPEDMTQLTDHDFNGSQLPMFMPSPHPEALERTALKRKSDGKVFTGSNARTPHWMIPNEHEGIRDYFGMDGHKNWVDGWVDNKGDFLDKEQGYKRAIETKQLPENASTEYKGALSSLDAKQAQFMPAVPRAAKSAEDYVRKSGIGEIIPPSQDKVDVARARKIAQDYEALPKVDNSPETKKSYETFRKEVDAQYQHALDSGIKFEFTSSDPYKNSADMMSDVENGRLRVYTGGEDHPYLGESTRDDTGLTANDKFRAVHDLYGHASEGNQFGPQGEERAWKKHSAMFSDEARPAMTAETRGQNSWVNYGPHMFDEIGWRGAKDHPNYIAPQDRPFAEQKAALLPNEHSFMPETPKEGLSKLNPEDRLNAIEVGEPSWSIRLRELNNKDRSTGLTDAEEKESLDLYNRARSDYGSYENWFNKFEEKNYTNDVFKNVDREKLGGEFMPSARLTREAEGLHLEYKGDMGNLHLYNDPITKSTITVKQDAPAGTLQAKLRATREKFLNPDRLSFMPSDNKDAIKEAAIRTKDGEMFTGSTHGEAFSRAIEKYMDENGPGSTEAAWSKYENAEDGYIDGNTPPNFYDRNAAKEQAKKIGQVTEGGLKKANDYYGGLEGGSGLESLNFARARKFMPASKNEGFYSQLEKHLEDKMPNKTEPDQLAGILKGGAVKKSELEWSGINDLIESAKKEGRQVTKQEALDWVRANTPEVTEKTLGGEGEMRKAVISPSDGFIDWADENDLSPIGRRTIDRAGFRIEDYPEGTPEPKYSQYQLEGGTNYRELLLTLPRNDRYKLGELSLDEEASNEGGMWIIDAPGQTFQIPKKRYQLPQEAMEYIAETKPRSDTPPPYKSPHFDKGGHNINLLGHLRVNDRKLPDGGSMLFAEEMQSDWAQAGRKEGFRQGVGIKEAEARIAELKKEESELLANGDFTPGSADNARLTEIQNADYAERKKIKAASLGVPDMPFKGNAWKTFLMRQLIKKAISEGKDAIGWTTGEQQAERYDLSKHVDEIQFTRSSGSDHGDLVAIKDGEDVLSEGDISVSELDKYIGKEAAKKLLEQNPSNALGEGVENYTLGGDGLKVGGEGMKGFYDKELVNIANDIGKKYGAKVEQVEIPTTQERYYIDESTQGQYIVRDRETGKAVDSTDDINDTDALLREYQEKNDKNVTVHSLKITPEMRKSIAENGQPLFMPQSNPATISQRVPTAKKATENALTGDALQTGLISILSDPRHSEKINNAVKEYAFRADKSAPPEQLLNDFVNHAKDNLLWLHDQMPPEIRDRAKKWYDGANKIAGDLSEEFGHPKEAIAGVMAALSPQNPWHNNVSLAERVLGVYRDQQGFRFDKAMAQKAQQIGGNSEFQAAVKDIKGKTFSELDNNFLRAVWLRLYDEAHNPREYRVVTPEGGRGGIMMTGDNPTPSNWFSLGPIEKALNVLDNPTRENISLQMGFAHKVRNFYNNIIDPQATDGSYTSDTHNVAAAMLKPLGGTALEVLHNSGNTPTGVKGAGKSAITGNKGTYGLYAEAGRRAAAERGLLPREMQSITWEAVRGLFDPEFKRDENSVAQIEQLWQNYANGKATINETRDQIKAIAGGITPPEWADQGPEATGGTGSISEGQGPIRPRTLSDVSVPRGSATKPRGGRAPARRLAEIDQPFMPQSEQIQATGIIRKKPVSGDLMLLNPEERVIHIGTATARLNRMTGDWLVEGQRDDQQPYIMDSEQGAAKLAATIDHYNKTGERKKFGKVKIDWVDENKKPKIDPTPRSADDLSVVNVPTPSERRKKLSDL